MLNAGHYFKPDRLICLGDLGDFENVSRHDKRPGAVPFPKEVEATNRALFDLESLGAKTNYFVVGNHENRLEDYTFRNAPAVAEFLSLRKVLRLDAGGWKVTPYGDVLKIGKCYYAHDPSGAGPSAHTRALVRVGHSVVHGHTHRAAVAYAGDITGTKRVGMMAGWLGDPRNATYMHKVGRGDWMHSFAIGYLEPNGVTHLQLIPIIRGRCVIEGKLVTA